MTNSWVELATGKPWKTEPVRSRKISRSKAQNDQLVRDVLERGINRPCDVAKELEISESSACRIMKRIGYHRIPITKAGTTPIRIKAIAADGSSVLYPSQVAAAKAHGLDQSWISKLSRSGKETFSGTKFERIYEHT